MYPATLLLLAIVAAPIYSLARKRGDEVRKAKNRLLAQRAQEIDAARRAGVIWRPR